jgi:hypothetical protein
VPQPSGCGDQQAASEPDVGLDPLTASELSLINDQLDPGFAQLVGQADG